MHAKESRSIRPSNSYELSLPRTVAERHDAGVSSFWLANEPLLLQLSSYIRREGPQVTAQDRLRDRIAKTPGNWCAWKQSLSGAPDVDQAAAELLEGGVLWMHCYLVWPHLTIYATISGPPGTVRDPNNWALEGLGSLTPIIH